MNKNQIKPGNRPRFQLTSAEWKAVSVLFGLMMLGILVQQFRNWRNEDRNAVVIQGVTAGDTVLLSGPESTPAVIQDGRQGSIPLQEPERKDQLQHLDTVPDLPESGGGTGQPGQIDINFADTSTLQSLPGIGPVLAERIVEFRSLHGPFQRIDDLLLIRGIGEKRFEAIQSLVTIK